MAERGGQEHKIFLQTNASSRRKNNSIDKLRLDTGLAEDKEVIKEEILNFYENLQSANEAWDPMLVLIMLPEYQEKGGSY